MIMAVEDFEVIMICVHILVLSLTRCVAMDRSSELLSCGFFSCKMGKLALWVLSRFVMLKHPGELPVTGVCFLFFKMGNSCLW